MATSWTEADITALEAAIASGVGTVKYAGPPAREITYQSTDAMLKALALMKREVRGVIRYRKVKFKRGFRE